MSEKAKRRIKVIDWLKNHNGNISLAARHFGLEREPIRIWKNRFDKEGLLGLNDKSHRPKNPRKPTTPYGTISDDEEEFFFKLKKRPAHYDELRERFASYLYEYNNIRPHLRINLKTPKEVAADVVIH